MCRKIKSVWKNPEAKKEILTRLDKIDKGTLGPRNTKDFKGFKTLRERKFRNTRMLVRLGEKGNSDEIIAIFMRYDMDNISSKFKGNMTKINI